MSDPNADIVLICGDVQSEDLRTLLERYGLEMRWVGDAEPIPGSHWGDSEAGLLGTAVYARRDTPVHSLLHETCHSICMDGERRRRLDTDAQGDDAEENAVCYLQILLADEIPGFGAARAMRDMDAWGYSFRLGSAGAWFDGDGDDARDWLLRNGLIDPAGHPLHVLRQD